ncbi:hypothetical protein CANARDRAFT_184186, partial [[Candida] arabinofermentans NRRL YB-2248]
STSTSSTVPNSPEIQSTITYAQSPNRPITWSPSQQSKDHILKSNVRFVGKDLSKQPNPQSAIDLIALQPITFMDHGVFTAVCNGTDPQQGHPKIFIDLKKDKVGTCGYCGNKFAREELKGKL